MADVTSRPQSVDHGYAWVILASTSIMRLLIDGFWTSFGVIFVNVELYFGVSAAETSVIGSIFMLNLSFMGKLLLYQIHYSINLMTLLKRMYDVTNLEQVGMSMQPDVQYILPVPGAYPGGRTPGGGPVSH